MCGERHSRHTRPFPDSEEVYKRGADVHGHLATVNQPVAAEDARIVGVLATLTDREGVGDDVSSPSLFERASTAKTAERAHVHVARPESGCQHISAELVRALAADLLAEHEPFVDRVRPAGLFERAVRPILLSDNHVLLGGHGAAL